VAIVEELAKRLSRENAEIELFVRHRDLDA
jgi:hypothetical protein